MKNIMLPVWRYNTAIIWLSSLLLFFVISICASPEPVSLPSLSRVYNQRFVPEVQSSPELGASGTLDATFNDAENSLGSISLSSQLSDSQAQAIVALANGDFLVALSSHGGRENSRLAKYNAQGVVLSDSYGFYGTVELPDQSQYVLTMILDVQGRSLVGGGDDTTLTPEGWLCRVSSDGQTVTSFDLAGWNFVGGLAEQSTGKIIAVGRVVQSGSDVFTAVVRYNLDGTLDNSFGSNGMVLLNGSSNLPLSTTGAYSVVVGEDDKIYLPYVDENGMVWVTRFTAAGVVDPTWFTSFYGAMVPAGHSFLIGTLTPTSSTTSTFYTSSSASYSHQLATFSLGSGFPYYTGTLNLSGSNGTFMSDSGSFITTSVAIPWLEHATPSSLRMAIDVYNNLILGAQVGTAIKVDGIQISDGSHAYIDPFDSSSAINSDSLNLFSLITTHDNFILLGGRDSTAQQQVIIKLMGTADIRGPGHLDPTFNQTGYIIFQAYTNYVEGQLYDICLSPDGRIYTVSAEFFSGVNFPYVSRLYNTLYDSQVMQSPATQEQGIIDYSFGQNSVQTYRGVINPYYGSYRGNLEQESASIIEVGYSMYDTDMGLGDLLVGSNGYTNTSNLSNMIFTWLDSSGVYDTNFGVSGTGRLLLDNESDSNEFIYVTAQEASGSIYVAGQANNLAILRKYSATSTTNWTNGISEWSVTAPEVSGYYEANGYGIALQQTNGLNKVILLHGLYGDEGSIGMISAYNANTGELATGTPAFGDGGSGYIYYNSFGLNMAQLYGAVINSAGIIFVAYGNSNTRDGNVGQIDVAAFKPDGSGLVTEFGVDGVVSNVLQSSEQKFWNVNIAAAQRGNIFVSSCDDNYVNVAKLDGITGNYDQTFNRNGLTPGLQSIPLDDTNIYNLQGLTDGSVMITGYIEVENAQQFMIRLAADGLVDESFNSQGATPGIYLDQIGMLPSAFFALAVQSTTNNVGNLALAGAQYQGENQISPTVSRLYGQPGTTAIKNYPTEDQYPGTLDVQLNGTGYQDLTDLIANGVAKVVFAYPEGNEFEGMLLIAVDNGVSSVISRVDETYMTIDTNFGIEGSGFYGTPSGISCLVIDSRNNILACGTDGFGAGAGWAQQITPNGSRGIEFQFPANNIQVNVIGEQKSGRYILAGQNIYTQNIIYAFQDQLVDDNSMLQLDPTFNPLGGPESPNGPLSCFVIGFVSGGVYSLVINDDDTILVAGQLATPGSYVQVAKITANGSGLYQGFGDGGTGIVTTGIESDNTSSARIVVDGDGNIIIAASCDAGSNVQAIRYTAVGEIDNTWNTVDTVGTITTISSADIGTDVVLTNIIETQLGQTILCGNNSSDSPDGYLFAVRLDSTGILDETWNPNGTTPGVLSFYVDNAWYMGVQSWIGISGNIWTTSYGDSPNYYPSLIEIVGDVYVQQYPQAPLAVPAGNLDYTLDASGALNLTTQLGYNFGVPAALSILSDQSMIMACDTMGINIVKINPVLNLDTTFNTSPGMGEVAGQVFIPVSGGLIQDLFVADAQGDDGTIYCTGGDFVMWAVKVSADGSSVTQLTANNNLIVGGAIRQTPTGNIIVAGYNGASGVLAEFSSDMTTLNSSFGSGGYYQTGVDSPIYAMTIDDDGFIYIAYKQFDAELLVVQKIYPNGSGVDTAFDPEFTVPCTNPQQVCLQLDQVNDQVIVACQALDGDYVVYVHRYSAFDGTDTGGDVEIAIPGATCNLASLFIDTNEDIYVVGYTPSDTYTTFVARIISTSDTSIELDTQNYAADSDTPGIANVVAGPLTRSLTRANGLAFKITGGILDQDRRVYVVGLSGGHTPYMARFFGDNYYTQVSQAIPLAPSGGPASFDDTYGVNGIVTTSAGVAADEGQQAFGILPIATGTNIMTLITNADGTQSWTARQLANGSNDDTYTTGGPGNGIAIAQIDSGLDYSLGMVFDGSGNSIVYGFNTINGGFIKSILPSGAMNSSFNGATTTPASPTGTSYISQFVVINAVAQLTNGNFVCVGKNNDNLGVVAQVSPNGQLVSSSLQNFGTNISSVSIDAQDNIYLAVGSASTASVLKMNSSGVVDSSYVANDVISNVYNTENIRLVLNYVGNIVVAASINNGEDGVIVQLVGLLSDGSIDTDFNQLTIPFTTNTNGVLTSLVALQNGNLLLAGYQHDFDDSDNMDYEFVASVLANGTFDTTFNPDGSPAGLLLFQVASGQQADRNLWAMSVQYDGKILLAGSEESMDDVATPLTMRLEGYPGVKSIRQFIGDVPTVPSLLNPVFNGTGIAFTPGIVTLVDGGSTVVDSQGRVLIAGRTNYVSTFVVARFLSDGTLDPEFNGSGISETPELATLVSGSFITLDSDNNVYVAGVTSDATFLVAKFLATDGSLDTTFNPDGLRSGVVGVAESYGVDEHLNYGGYVAIDYLGNVLIAGSASDENLVVCRLLPDGSPDINFGPVVPGMTTSGAISGLLQGGSIATAQPSLLFVDDNSCYVGGVVSSGGEMNLIAVKFDGNGYVDGSFGTGGVATSVDIPGLVSGGVLALTTNRKVVVGGFTTNKAFVAAQFLETGLFDPFFDGGVAYSSELTSLDSCLGICVDMNDNVILGGTSTAYDGVSKSMVIARMTPAGDVDTTLSSTGIASTGIIAGLVSGGFVATNLLNNPFVGGFDGDKLVVAEIYSGAEIFITNPSSLPAAEYKIYWFGNIPSLFQNYLAIEIFAQIISDELVRQDVIDKVHNSLNTYTSIYQDQVNLNLLANTTPGWDGQFEQLRLFLIVTHPESEDQINSFFSDFNTRRFIIHQELAQLSAGV